MARSADRSSVSVIVPSYNGAAFLSEALDSIFAQDPAPDEVILVDDGSTDSTAEIAAGYGSRVLYHRQPRAGAGAARNTGVRLARGGYIGFLDSDDLWPAGSLRVRSDALLADAEAACVTGLIEHFATDQNGTAKQRFRLPDVRPARQLSAMLIRRPVFDRIGGFDETGRLGDAIDWVARLSDHGLGVLTLDRLVLRRRIHGHNMGVLRQTQRNEYLHVLKGVIDRRRAASLSGLPLETD
jgi:glycosyltransferase involved in cell wall biosynthesis